MARHKTTTKKNRLAKEQKKSMSVPAWVMARTKGTVRRTPKQRSWRKRKIKL